MITNLSALFVVSVNLKALLCPFILKSGESSVSTKLIDGEAFVIVIFPVESTVPLTLRLLPIVVIPAIETPPCS